MKTSNLSLLHTFSFSLLFALFFFEHTWGLNLFLLQLALFLVPILNKQFSFQGIVNFVLSIGTLAAIVFTFLNHSTIGLVVSWLCIGLFYTSAVNMKIKSLDLALISSFVNTVLGVPRFLKAAKQIRLGKGKSFRLFPRLRVLTPALVVVVFIVLYNNSSPTFNNISAGLFDFFEEGFELIIQSLNIVFIGWFILGIIIMSSLFLKQDPNKWFQKDFGVNSPLVRTKNYFSGKLPALKTENKLGVRLLFILNGMALVVIFGEVKDVWMNFQFEGQLLKEFVHSSMYTLLVAVLISIGIALYYFRGNQNFYKKNKLLKTLTAIWLVENAVLVIAVFVRNYIYIQHYALAYKRIALIFFLVACLVGIVSVSFKIFNTYNTRFLMRINSLSIFTLVVFSTLFNWDVVIAEYNFSNKERSFVHLNYLATLNNASLPYLSKDPEVLNQIQTRQKKRFSSSSYKASIDAKTYTEIIENKEATFLQFWENKHWLEWNPSEQKAYEHLLESRQ